LRTISTVSFFFFLIIYQFIKRFKKKPQSPLPVIIGHRGAAGYCPENTFASFHYALKLGVDYLEIDIQMTKDGELVVIHDPIVNRTTNGKGKVKEFTLAEIQALDAGSWFHPKFHNEKIPSLQEFLDEFAGRVGLILELKKPSLYPGIEEKVGNELLRRGLVSGEQVIVQSFDCNSLKRFHSMIPSIQIGVLVKKISYKELFAISSYASYINLKVTLVNKGLVIRLHQLGLKTFIWTVRNKKEAELLKYYGVDGIITDYPDINN